MLTSQQFQLNSRRAVYKFLICLLLVLFIWKQYFPAHRIPRNHGTIWKPLEHARNESFRSTGVLLFLGKGFGLGNQLFFYSLSYALSRNLGIPLLLPVPTETTIEYSHKNFSSRDHVLDHLSLPGGVYTDYKLISTNKSIYVVTCAMAQNKSLIPPEALKRYRFFSLGGFCFDWTFFREYEDELKGIHVILERPSEGYKRWEELINRDEWPVAVHVRKGDLADHFYNSPIAYFKAAMREIIRKTPSGLTPVFYVFSDEMNWVKEGLSEGFFLDELHVPVNFVSGTFGGLTNLEELDLMTKCKSIIISNSTFSWWAAFLMKRNKQKIVIRPEFNASWHEAPEEKKLLWYGIGYPEEWIPLEA